MSIVFLSTAQVKAISTPLRQAQGRLLDVTIHLRIRIKVQIIFIKGFKFKQKKSLLNETFSYFLCVINF